MAPASLWQGPSQSGSPSITPSRIFLLFQAGPAYLRSVSWDFVGFPLTGSTSYFSIPPHWTVSTTASSRKKASWNQGCDPFLFWAPIASVPSRTSQSTPAFMVQYLNIVHSGREAGAFWEAGECLICNCHSVHATLGLMVGDQS